MGSQGCKEWIDWQPDGQDTQLGSGPASVSDYKDEKKFIFWILIYKIKIFNSMWNSMGCDAQVPLGFKNDEKIINFQEQSSYLLPSMIKLSLVHKIWQLCAGLKYLLLLAINPLPPYKSVTEYNYTREMSPWN